MRCAQKKRDEGAAGMFCLEPCWLERFAPTCDGCGCKIGGSVLTVKSGSGEKKTYCNSKCKGVGKSKGKVGSKKRSTATGKKGKGGVSMAGAQKAMGGMADMYAGLE
jgi:hypothetical protein